MPLFQKPVFYPPTVMDREAAAILSIRVRTRPPVGGGGANHFLPITPATAGSRVSGGARIQGGTFSSISNANQAT